MHRTPTIIALAATGLVASAVTAETITVCAAGCEFTSINAAIVAASDGDVIQLSAATYFEGEPVDPLGKAITIRGTMNADGTPATILDGGGSHRVLVCTNGEGPTTAFQDLVIQNGWTASDGGGLFTTGTPYLDNCILTNNAAAEGGAISALGFFGPNVIGCTVCGNDLPQILGNIQNLGTRITTDCSTAPPLTVCAAGCDFTSINAAIAAANPGDVIQLSAETYTEGAAVDPLGKAITIRGAVDGGGSPTSILDGPGGGAATILCTSGEGADTVFQNLVVRNGGQASMPYPDLERGGMSNIDSHPTVTNSTFTENARGMANIRSSPFVRRCRFTDNGGIRVFGAGMMNYESHAVIVDCTFRRNTAAGGGLIVSGDQRSPGGGGMYNFGGEPVVSRCVFASNSTFFDPDFGGGFGAGMWNERTDVIVRDCTFRDNVADGNGGGLAFSYETDSPQVINCTIIGNRAFSSFNEPPPNPPKGRGGGVWVWDQQITVEALELRILDCTITNNEAADVGGGVCVTPFDGIFFRWSWNGTTICGNTAGVTVNGVSTDQVYAPAYPPLEDYEARCVSDDCVDCLPLDCPFDSDSDGTLDCFDGCPYDPLKTDPGDCGCGEPETTDTDDDGTADCLDGCPHDPLKTDPGDCGCGEPETDTDRDGTPDCLDGCPGDPLKTEPGSCGCGVVDTNVNGDVDCDGDYDEDDIRLGMADFGITAGTPGDMDGDDDADVTDFTLLRDQIGLEALGCVVADINGDGQVDGADFAYVLGYWGVCSAP